MNPNISRRSFVKGGTATMLGAASVLASPRAQGANERIRLGFIGVGNRGGQLIEAARAQDDMEIVALCDVYKPYLDKWSATLGSGVDTYADFREVLDREDVDAVVIATPEHWHAIQCIQACAAGKDVYVEKPASYTIHEGRRMVEAARAYKRIVQVGLQRRSSRMYAELGERIRGGAIGHVSVMRAYRLSNMFPDGIGNAPDSDPPSDLDWDMWLGPRPMRRFNPNIAPYKFRWWKEYSSQMANWGVHYFDLLRWLSGDAAPASVSAHGGQFASKDARTIPDTMEATVEFASGRLLFFGQYEACSAPMIPGGGEIEVRGTLGTLTSGNRGYELKPERAGQFQEEVPRCEAQNVKSEDGDLDQAHMRNFLDCVRSRETPNADIEEGHRSTVFAHLANIALETKSRIEWDAGSERITNIEEANGLLHYEYRAPWALG